MHPVELVAAALLGAKMAADVALTALNRREIVCHAGAVPPAYAGVMDAPTYAKAVDYSLAKNAFARWEELYGAVADVLAYIYRLNKEQAGKKR